MDTVRCSRCILPETYPGITFDKEGVCNPCRSFKKNEVLGETELRKVMTSKKGEPYDCIVMLSGGRDSSYVLYYLVRVLGLKVVTYTYDNGFRHPQAVINMENACKAMDVPLIERRSRDDLGARIVSSWLKAAMRFGPGPCMAHICRHCYMGGLTFLYSLANEHKIPFIVWGDAHVEKPSFIKIRKESLGMKGSWRLLASSGGPRFAQCIALLLQQKNEPQPWSKLSLIPSFPRLRNSYTSTVHLFDYIEWDRNTIKETIRDELGWEKPPGAVSTWRFDCNLHALMNYMHKKAIGFNHDVDGLANMVRAGKMRREEAMSLVEKGFDSGEWSEKLDHLTQDVLKLSQREIDTMKNW